LLACLLPAACGSEALGLTCGLGPAVHLPLHMVGDAAIISVTINDRGANLILDTGAERSVLGTGIAAVLGVHASGGPSITTGAVGGISHGQLGVIDHMQVGGQRIDSLSVGIMDNAEFDGVLGLDVLSRYEVDVNLPKGEVTLHRGSLCAKQLPPIPGPVLEIPAVHGVVHADGKTQPEDPYLMVPISLDGIKALAMLDTGALPGSLVSSAFAGLAGVPESALVTDPPLSIRGFGTSAVTHRHRFGQLLIGREVFDLPTLLVGGQVGGQVPVILGSDYFRVHRVWFDFAGARVFVVPVAPNKVPVARAK
jgi:hypothetical protein